MVARDGLCRSLRNPWLVTIPQRGQSGSQGILLAADKEKNLEKKNIVNKFKIPVGINNQNSSYIKTFSKSLL